MTLPKELLAVIRTITSDEDLPPNVRLTGVIMLIQGWAWFERQEKVDPRAIALPSKQWLEVCEMLTFGVVLEEIAGVNLGQSFMNSGPSSYTAEPEL